VPRPDCGCVHVSGGAQADSRSVVVRFTGPSEARDATTPGRSETVPRSMQEHSGTVEQTKIGTSASAAREPAAEWESVAYDVPLGDVGRGGRSCMLAACWDLSRAEFFSACRRVATKG